MAKALSMRFIRFEFSNNANLQYNFLLNIIILYNMFGIKQTNCKHFEPL